MNRDALELVAVAIQERTVDAAVAALRAVEAAPDSDSVRRMAVERVTSALTAMATERRGPVVDLLIWLRRVQ
jgi:hypothetical protein